MNGLEIKNFILKFPNLKPHFKGIYFIDKLPLFVKKYSFLICNTDFSGNSGKHWIVFFKINNIIECFDSLGIDDEKKALLKKYCKFKNTKEILFNETVYQADNSLSCGKFVLYFVLERFYNLDMTFEEILSESFDFNPILNEKKVDDFYTYHSDGD